MSTPDPTFTLAPAEPPSPPLRAYAAVLALLALGLAALVVALTTHRARTALFQVLPSAVAMLLGGGATALWLLRRRAPLWLLLPGAALACEAALLATVVGLATLWGRPLDDVFARPLVQRGLLGAPLLGALIAAGLWLLERTLRRERAAWEAERAARMRQGQLEHERTLAQLQLLQAQVEPHFIYNTLANLRQLVRLDAARALQMLDHLIRYFKLTLPNFRAERVPLSDELVLAGAYLELLRERLGRPMELVADVPQALAGFALPPGALLCLAENAVKHGLPEDGTPLRLHVSARRAGECLLLTVRDNGSGLAAVPRGASRSGGTGLANLRERLRLLYGDAASLQLRDAHPGCEAVLSLPWQP